MTSRPKKNADNICDSINLASLTKLQSYAAALIIDRKSKAIIQYSDNTSSLLKTSVSNLNTQLVSQFISCRAKSDSFNKWLAKSDKRYRSFIWKGDKSDFPVWVYIHQQPQIILLEIELVEVDLLEEDIFFVIDEIANLNMDKSYERSEDCANQICKKLQEITGYDRTIIYRFEADNSGVVIGEAIKTGMESYLGLRFPATDIPEAVRALYLKQPLRYIPDIRYTPVSLIPDSILNVDLTELPLRAVSPVHLEYLQNMGVTSSLSVAIINNNTLWGLIAFHHREPRKLSPEYRFGLLLLAKNLARTFIMIDNIKRSQEAQAVFKKLQNIQSVIYKESSLLTVFKRIKSELLSLFSAHGVAYCYQERVYQFGLTPTDTQITHLVDWLAKKPPFKLFSTNKLPEDYPLSSEFDTHPCGLLVIPLSTEDKHCLLLFRQVLFSQVSWAGDPNRVLTIQDLEYSPRQSFNIWKEIVYNQADSWKEFELSAGLTVSQTLINKFMQQLMHENAIINVLHQEEIKKNLALLAKDAQLEILVAKRSDELLKKNKSLSQALLKLKEMQENIIQTAKMATIGQLAAGVAHEINNPLSYILNNIYLLKKYFGLMKIAFDAYSQLMDDLNQNPSYNDSEQYQEIILFNQNNKLFTKLGDLDNIFSETIEGSLRIKQIVSNLTSFSGGAHEGFEIIDVNELIETAINITFNELKYKTTLVKNLTEIPKISVSPKQLELVFVNLLLNAAQSIETRGEIEISSSLSGLNILVTVSDTGCGIPSDSLPKLFTPFFTTKPIGSSTGLGLANAYGYIKSLGGRITVKSKVGKGSTFSVYLPINIME
jgi:light-regulated signal transduction histidine kinase (bacteriophytochrome)